MRSSWIIFTLLALSAWVRVEAASATFTPLGDLPGGLVSSLATGISDNGRVVVGYSASTNGNSEAFRWTREEGMIGLGSLSSGENFASSASATSGDGRVVVGQSRGVNGNPAFRWTKEGGMIGLGVLAGGLNSRVSAISSDGRFAVGTVAYPEGSGREAFIWDQVNGMRGLGNLGGVDSVSDGNDGSPDGRVVVGGSYNDVGRFEAFRWTAETGMLGLGFLDSSSPDSSARWVSTDGEVIYGYSLTALGTAVFRWTKETGMTALLRENFSVTIWAVSADGTTIAGAMDPGSGSVAYIWDEARGIRNLQETLIADYELGDALSGWVIEEPHGLSFDGTKIVGSGINPDGNTEAFLIDLAPTAPPEIATSPVAATVGTTGSTTLSVEATGEDLHYQWQHGGVDILGATEATYTIPSAQRYHAGDYTVIVSNSGGSASSAAATVTVEPPPTSDARLTNLSTRALALTGNNVLIPGFVIAGTGAKSLLIRAVGASLRQDPFNLPTALEDPQMTLKRWTGSAFEEVLTNDDWETNANAAELAQATLDLGAFALTDGKDAALYTDLEAGRYTVVAGGVGDLTGVAIVELYDADGEGGTTVLANISNRGFVGTGSSIMIPGISVSSEGPKTFLIRAVGPALGLAPFNLTGVLEDPVLTVFSGPDPILGNDNWGENPDAAYTAEISAQLGAFGLPEGSKDAAFVVTLPPGSYTIKAAGVDGVTGTAIVEVYVVE